MGHIRLHCHVYVFVCSFLSNYGHLGRTEILKCQSILSSLLVNAIGNWNTALSSDADNPKRGPVDQKRATLIKSTEQLLTLLAKVLSVPRGA